jgi:hypothetical protein
MKLRTDITPRLTPRRMPVGLGTSTRTLVG